ncbi:globin domain-containing protein [Pseudoalteromonas fenneropenaei]|uniref:Globin domain-containing protein n=1 Tax=Pseudoalteromonas fenneropenaei TaxID=1737459 RepID=A0ABV7CM85_9GAMM
MAITRAQQQLLQQSLEQLIVIPAALDDFYAALIEFAPHTATLFSTERTQHSQRLLIAFQAIIKGLEQPEKLVPLLQRLAQRHLDYGVTTADFTPFGNAWLYVLKAQLGDTWSPAHRDAWVALLRLIATVMKQQMQKQLTTDVQ